MVNKKEETIHENQIDSFGQFTDVECMLNVKASLPT